jgi:hypothetical protein
VANVNIPKIDTAETDIKVLVPQLLNAYAKLTKELSWLLNNLDTRNLNYVDGDLLVEGTVTAAKMLVNELSAISANLGKIVSGEIYGTYIATRDNAFPRAELNDSGDLLAVYTDENNSVTIEPGLFNEPSMVYRRGASVSLALGPIGIFSGLISPIMSMLVGSQNGSLSLQCGNGVLDEVQVPSWEKFRGVANGETLADILAEKASAGNATGSSGGANGGIPVGTKLAVDGGGYVVWNGIPSHSHTQT